MRTAKQKKRLDLSTQEGTKSFAYFGNAGIAAMVIGMMAIYYVIGATFLVYYSCFVFAGYLVNFWLIYKDHLRGYVWLTYAMLTLYMGICTVMLGYEYGFQLYSMSTISLLYYIKYVGNKIGGKDVHPGFWSAAIILSCVLSSMYVVEHGPVYQTSKRATISFLIINIITVCYFLISYSRRMLDLVADYEDKLEKQAHFDALTGLANRYYIGKAAEEYIAGCTGPGDIWICMVDIDNFKSINDGYGHSVGDTVLKTTSAVMKEVCAACTVGRWGGEEFLIIGKKSVVSEQVIQELVRRISELETDADGRTLRYTITAGVAFFEPGTTIDRWIRTADDNLYIGKGNGKNQAVY